MMRVLVKTFTSALVAVALITRGCAASRARFASICNEPTCTIQGDACSDNSDCCVFDSPFCDADDGVCKSSRCAFLPDQNPPRDEGCPCETPDDCARELECATADSRAGTCQVRCRSLSGRSTGCTYSAVHSRDMCTSHTGVGTRVWGCCAAVLVCDIYEQCIRASGCARAWCPFFGSVLKRLLSCDCAFSFFLL